jgi:hypothetical protein
MCKTLKTRAFRSRLVSAFVKNGAVEGLECEEEDGGDKEEDEYEGPYTAVYA